ncbi:hypothetical protein WJX72_007441 [[Myrmecia] bisecta]|uniref:Uncharacterized protein n=1 Tax=[Myrmecia] bisecta TaxID=41462 RepID=A0AAW1PB06_9CHLO
MHLDGQAPTADQQAAGSGSGPGQNGRSPSAAAAAAAASQQMVKRVSGRLQPSLSAICERASTDSNTRSSGDAFSSGDSGLGSWGGSGRPGLPNLAAASSLPLPRAANNDSLEGLPLWRRSFDEADRSEHAPLQRSGSLSRSHSLSMEGWRGPLRRASAESMAPTGSAPLSFVNRLPPRETLIQRSSSLSISGTLSDDSLASSTDPAASASQSELSPTSTQRLDAFQKSTWRPTSDAPACTAAAQAFPSNGAPAQQPAGVFCSNGSAPIGRSTGSPTRTSAIYRASHAGTASISMLSAIQSSRERAARVTNPFAVTSAAAAGGAVVPGSGVSHAESEPKAKSAHDSSKWDQALSGEWQDAPASVRRCDSAWSLRLPRAQERRSLGCGGESEAGSKDLGPGSGESDAVAQEGVPELTAV